MLILIALQLSSFFESFFLFNKSVALLSEAQEKVLHGLFLSSESSCIDVCLHQLYHLQSNYLIYIFHAYCSERSLRH